MSNVGVGKARSNAGGGSFLLTTFKGATSLNVDTSLTVDGSLVALGRLLLGDRDLGVWEKNER